MFERRYDNQQGSASCNNHCQCATLQRGDDTEAGNSCSHSKGVDTLNRALRRPKDPSVQPPSPTTPRPTPKTERKKSYQKKIPPQKPADLLLDETQSAILNQIGHVVVLRGVPSRPLVVEPVVVEMPEKSGIGSNIGLCVRVFGTGPTPKQPPK